MAYVTRAEWSARAPRDRDTVPLSQITEFVQHYSTGEELGRDDCAEWVRQIQAFHMDSRGWSDIGYTELVCRHGDVFEGRGLGVIGAHAPGHNAVSVGVCFLGDDDPNWNDATPAARVAIRGRWGEFSRRCGRELRRLGHRQVKATTCPGDELFAWVTSGMPITADPVPAPTDPTEPPRTRSRYVWVGSRNRVEFDFWRHYLPVAPKLAGYVLGVVNEEAPPHPNAIGDAPLVYANVAGWGGSRLGATRVETLAHMLEDGGLP